MAVGLLAIALAGLIFSTNLHCTWFGIACYDDQTAPEAAMACGRDKIDTDPCMVQACFANYTAGKADSAIAPAVRQLIVDAAQKCRDIAAENDAAKAAKACADRKTRAADDCAIEPDCLDSYRQAFPNGRSLGEINVIGANARTRCEAANRRPSPPPPPAPPPLPLTRSTEDEAPLGSLRGQPRWCQEQAQQADYERAVCADDGLALKDIEMQALYNARKSAGSPAELNQLRGDQSSWKSRRVACGNDIECLNRVYSQRIEALRNAEAGRTGFYCGTVRSTTEAAICGNSVLSDLDGQMTILYEAALNANTVDASVLTREQVQTLRQRNACGSDESCIASVYRQRIARLRSL